MKIFCKETRIEYEITVKGSPVEETMVCPCCSAERKKNTIKCFSWNNQKKLGRCNHCGNSFYEKSDFKQEIKYEKPIWKNETIISDKIIKWFEERKISQKTLSNKLISEGKEYMPHASKEMNTIQYNYFREDELVNIKYRSADKGFKLAKGAELIFYNLNATKGEKEIFITEGENDTLALIEAGYKNSISVPNGANTKTNNLQYVDNCIDELMGLKIHIAVDNDIAGRKLREDLANRFGKENCDYIEFKDCKDANDCLIKYGIQGIIESCSNPKQFPLEGVFTISDISDEIDDMYVNGLDKGISLNIEGFDLNIVKGYITTITGIPGHGKSDWLDNMCLNAKIHNKWSGAFYSPENKPTQLHFSKMARKLIGKHWDGVGKMSEQEKELAKKYLDKSFWFLKPEKDFTLTSILSQVRNIQLRHGLDFFVIDAWNKLEHKYKDSQTDYIGRALDELAMFCELSNLHCFLVAHPTKMPKKENGSYEVPTLYNIAGSSNFYNKTDNGICIHRDFINKITTVYIQKVKFDHWGTESSAEYYYDYNSKRYFKDGKIDYTNWITKEERQVEFSYKPMTENTDFLNVNNRIQSEHNNEIEDIPF